MLMEKGHKGLEPKLHFAQFIISFYVHGFLWFTVCLVCQNSKREQRGENSSNLHRCAKFMNINAKKKSLLSHGDVV